MPDARRWLTFLWMNVLAAVVAVAIFVFVARADFLDDSARAVTGWLARHPGWSAWAASTPLLVTIAIGVHYGKKGMRKRREAAARGQKHQRCMITDDP